MTGNSILARFGLAGKGLRLRQGRSHPNMHDLWRQPARLPPFVATTPGALRVLDLLGPLDWAGFPERNLERNWGQTTVPYAALAAACLLKLNEGLLSMGKLRSYLLEHPGFIWLCGFPLVSCRHAVHRFDAEASLPTQRHLTQMVRHMPNTALQFLLADSVRLIRAELRTMNITPDDCIVLDTKHIIAWVKENNPKAYVEDRYDKSKQPAGDPDCRLGCKRRHNRQPRQPVGQDPPATPARNPVPAAGLAVGEYYWGYGSGVVVVPVPGWGEFVLAEMTQPFDRADVSYFFPLMTQTEARLGGKPRFGVFDAAFDAWYVYAYFHRQDDPDAFAAVPFSEKGGYKAKGRQFSPEGLPLCAAGKPMPLKFAFIDRTSAIIEHERGKYVCPLFHPHPSGEACPVNHKNWARKGCTAMMPTSVGARLRYQLDRDSQVYKDLYRQRTAAERINSQAVALGTPAPALRSGACAGVERPHLRNQRAIANLNTLTYILINLRFLHRLRCRHPAWD